MFRLISVLFIFKFLLVSKIFTLDSASCRRCALQVESKIQHCEFLTSWTDEKPTDGVEYLFLTSNRLLSGLKKGLNLL